MELIVSEGRVYGKRYFTVAPTSDFISGAAKWDAMLAWCVDYFGTTNTVWSAPGARWYANNAKFWIRDEEDLTLFLLRWAT